MACYNLGMTETTRELYEAVLALPEPERLGLIERLVHTVVGLDREADARWDQAWCDELDRRLQDLRQNSSSLAWEHVRDRLRSLAP